ncbi:MAG: SMC-Scp complex subunit ScpB, partial [Candidatus Omnitrophica bacterium]|nr:SMC-Scp complex subunit ScpB [Candidatus Omnitrophota bacterium]
MSDNSVKSVIEALLFASEKPLAIEEMKRIIGIDMAEVRKAIEELKEDYTQVSRGMRIAEVAGGYQMITAADFAPFLKKYYRARLSEKLS